MGRFRERTGSVGNLPTAALTNVLRSVCRTRANIYPTVRDEPPQTLVAARALDTADLCDAIRIWEQVILGAEDSSIRFSYNSRLADIISTVTPVHTQLSDEVRRIGTQPDAPGCVRGHEKVPACGQVEVLAGGQLKVPTPRSPCRPGV